MKDYEKHMLLDKHELSHDTKDALGSKEKNNTKTHSASISK